MKTGLLFFTFFLNLCVFTQISKAQQNTLIEKGAINTFLQNSISEADSVLNHTNKLKVLELFTKGYIYKYKNEEFIVKALLKSWSFNIVEGFVFKPSFQHQIFLKNNKRFQVGSAWRFTTQDTHFKPIFSAKYFGNARKLEAISLKGGIDVSQFEPNTVQESQNMLNTLLLKFNIMKIYERRFAEISYFRELFPGVQAKAKIGFNKRFPLKNNSDFTIRQQMERLYAPNTSPLDFSAHEALLFQIDVNVNCGQKYEFVNGKKSNYSSRYPQLNLRFTKGIAKILGSDVNFDKLEMTIKDEFAIGNIGDSYYHISAGSYINNKKLGIADYTFFNGNETFASYTYLQHYQLTKYYEFYTDKSYLKTFYEHHFKGSALQKVPIIKELKWKLVVGFNTFYVDKNLYYGEYSIGVENIFKIARFDFVQSFTDTKRWGVKLGFNFNQ
ncbi:MAG: DUF5686 family protein [Chitinophagales bacterium]